MPKKTIKKIMGGFGLPFFIKAALTVEERPDLADIVVEHKAGVFRLSVSASILPQAYRKRLERCDVKFRKHEKGACATCYRAFLPSL